MSDKLYTIDDVVATCNACGAYTLSRDPARIKHHPGCGGLVEVEKWDRYYDSPGWLEAVAEEVK